MLSCKSKDSMESMFTDMHLIMMRYPEESPQEYKLRRFIANKKVSEYLKGEFIWRGSQGTFKGNLRETFKF